MGGLTNAFGLHRCTKIWLLVYKNTLGTDRGFTPFGVKKLIMQNELNKTFSRSKPRITFVVDIGASVTRTSLPRPIYGLAFGHDPLDYQGIQWVGGLCQVSRSLRVEMLMVHTAHRTIRPHTADLLYLKNHEGAAPWLGGRLKLFVRLC